MNPTKGNLAYLKLVILISLKTTRTMTSISALLGNASSQISFETSSSSTCFGISSRDVVDFASLGIPRSLAKGRANGKDSKRLCSLSNTMPEGNNWSFHSPMRILVYQSEGVTAQVK